MQALYFAVPSTVWSDSKALNPRTLNSAWRQGHVGDYDAGHADVLTIKQNIGGQVGRIRSDTQVYS